MPPAIVDRTKATMRSSNSSQAGRLQHVAPVHIPGIGDRALTLYHPPARDPAVPLPIAILFDGQNLFRDEGSFAGGWHVHATLDRMAARGKKVPLVVGIHHGGSMRIEELSPWRISGGAGRADQLLAWITGKLLVQLHHQYPILLGPENTLIGGSSMGGLMALYAFCRHPEIFGRVLCMSPSLWVGGGAIFREVQHARLSTSIRIYLDAGGREGSVMHHAHQMARLLVHKGLDPRRQLMWRPDKRGSHNERAWRRRLPKAMRFLQYGQRRP